MYSYQLVVTGENAPIGWSVQLYRDGFYYARFIASPDDIESMAAALLASLYADTTVVFANFAPLCKLVRVDLSPLAVRVV